MSNTVRALRFDLPLLAGAVRSCSADDVRWEIAHLRRRLSDAVARDVAWALPRNVALWAFIRVCAEPGVHPDEITYESAYENWVAS